MQVTRITAAEKRVCGEPGCYRPVVACVTVGRSDEMLCCECLVKLSLETEEMCHEVCPAPEPAGGG